MSNVDFDISSEVNIWDYREIHVYHAQKRTDQNYNQSFQSIQLEI